MRHALKKNWTAKIVALLLATAIWFLIKGLEEAERKDGGMPSREEFWRELEKSRGLTPDDPKGTPGT